MKANRKFLMAAALLFAVTGSSHAEDGVSAGEVVLGMANALSGPAAGLGTGMRDGSQAYFNKLNAAGGIHGRKIKLISVDDGYEPAKTAAATTKLIEQDKVFALFGYVGTPTSAAAVPLATKAGVPYVAPFTGAEALRNPVNKVVFNVRASYFDETEAQVEHLTKDLGLKKIGVFIQDDAYGAAGKGGVLKALAKRSLSLAGEGKYKRNTVEVDEGIAALKASQPEAIIMVGAYKACAAFVKKAKAQGINAKFLNVSFVGTADFIKEAGVDGEGVYITQVVPSPDDDSIAIVKKYQGDMKSSGKSEFDYTSLEGYIGAAVMSEGLKSAGSNLTRDSFIGAMNALSTDVSGLKITFSPTSHQALKTVYLTQVKGGKAVPITKF
ncbi:MAG: ABC transporter substrate-binding protein [Sterolibacterium sp.]|jgi:ABC-type branched-subunit amino acid transport system substrate-binding protein|nr:ABC transporter substrate-binding protein [Sterolibacterium sp.]